MDKDIKNDFAEFKADLVQHLPKVEHVYIVFEKKSEKSIQLFNLLVEKLGAKGLVVSKDSPEYMRERRLTKPDVYFYLVASAGFNMDGCITCSISNFSPVLRKILAFLKKNKGNAVLFFDAFDALTVHRDFKKIVNDLEQLYEALYDTNTTMVLQISKDVIDGKKLNILTKIIFGRGLSYKAITID